MPSSLKLTRRRPAMAVIRVTALPAAVAVMAATVALSPSDRATAPAEPALSAPAFLAASVAHGELDFSLHDGSPAADLQHSLVHRSDGSFFLSLWRTSASAAGRGATVTVSFGRKVHEAEEIIPSVGTKAQRTWVTPRSVTLPVSNAPVALKIIPAVSTPAASETGAPPKTLQTLSKVATGVLRVDAGGKGDSLRTSDSALAPSPYLASGASDEVYYSPNLVSTTDPSVPADTPSSIFQSERWAGNNALGYDIRVPNGRFLIRLYTAETYAPAQKIGGRLMDVEIEGAVMQHDLDTFARVGANRGYVTNYVTAVTNGVLSLRLTNPRGTVSPHLDAFDVIPIAPEPPLSGPNESPAPPAPAPALGNISQVFARSSFWYQQLPGNAPLAANSQAVVANAVRQMHQYYGSASRTNVDINTTSYAAPVYVAAAGTPTVNVGFNDCQNKGYFDAGLKAQFTAVPIPSYAQPADGTDQEMVVYSPSQDQLWEFWVTDHDGPNWTACWGGRIDHVSQSSGIFPGSYGTTATGLPFMGGQISIADLQSGTINHALGIAFVETRSNTVSWPAQRTDAVTNDTTAPAEGQRFRLDPTLNIDALNLNPVAKMVAVAAQKYGLVVWDKAGAVSIRAESPKSLTTQGKADPYPTIFGNNANWNALDNIPWNRLQALPYNYGE